MSSYYCWPYGTYPLRAYSKPIDGWSDDAYAPDTAPSTSPAPYVGNENSDSGRVVIPLPAAPTDRAAVEGAIEDALEAPEGAALRCQIDWIFSQLPAPGDPIYAPGQPAPTLTVPDPAAGSPAADDNGECALASEILKLNPKAVAEGKLTAVGAHVIARTCIHYAQRTGLDGRSLCRSMPIFSSGSNNPETTQHDIDALTDPDTGNPAWLVLNYEYGTTKPGREWYTTQATCVQAALVGQHCDEYPFFATEQGGATAFPRSPLPNLRGVTPLDNQRQGGFYSAFITACDMRTGTPQAVGNSIGGDAFLGIPQLNVPTVWLCNGKTDAT